MSAQECRGRESLRRGAGRPEWGRRSLEAGLRAQVVVRTAVVEASTKLGL